jgi:hypothetical protein
MPSCSDRMAMSISAIISAIVLSTAA